MLTNFINLLYCNPKFDDFVDLNKMVKSNIKEV